MHTLKFNYEKIGEKFFPIIDVELRKDEKFIKTKAYIDSGATYSIFKSEFAEILKIDYKKGKKMFPIGISGHICAYLHEIKLKIENEEFNCDVLFSDECVVKFNLLGRVGLFDKFKICFEDKEKILTLQKKE